MMKHLTLRLCYGFLQGTQLHHPPERVENNIYWFRQPLLNAQFTFPQKQLDTFLTPLKKKAGAGGAFLVELWKITPYLHTHSQNVTTSWQKTSIHTNIKKKQKPSYSTNGIVLKNKKKTKDENTNWGMELQYQNEKRYNKSSRYGFTLVHLKYEWNRQLLGKHVLRILLKVYQKCKQSQMKHKRLSYYISVLSEYSQATGKEGLRKVFSMLTPVAEEDWEKRCAWGTFLKSLRLSRNKGGEGKKVKDQMSSPSNDKMMHEKSRDKLKKCQQQRYMSG